MLNEFFLYTPPWGLLLLAAGWAAIVGWSPALVGPGLLAGLALGLAAFQRVRFQIGQVEHGQSAETAPVAGESRLAALMEAIDEPLLLVQGRRVMRANKAGLALFGAHIEDEDIRLAIRHPAAAALFSRFERSNEPQARQLKGFGGPDRRWQMRIAPLGDGAALVRLADLSQQDAADRMRTDFVANASHELRTPIAALLGFIETLNDPMAGGDPATRKRFLGIMATEAKRMDQLVNDLISLSRIEADRYTAPAGEVDIGALAHVVANQIMAAGVAAAGQIAVDVAEGAPSVKADRGQIEQLLHNLMGNAVKYGRAGAPVRVTVRPDVGDMVRLSVADEGEGISPDHLPRLTERFYRVDAGRSRASGGTGLGLAIVKNIVERHRGTLNFASQQGVGTNVTVRLPMVVPVAGLSAS